jgi:hypothetical protein
MKPATPTLEEPVVSLLRRSTSVAYARFGKDGVLKDANQRLLGLLEARGASVRLEDMVTEGQREAAAAVFRERELPPAGLNLHLANGTKAPVSLRVAWEWDGEDLVMLGEAPIEELEEAQSKLLRLNNQVANLARDNAKKSAALEKALADLGHSTWHLKRLQELLPICVYCRKVRTGEDYWQSVEAYLEENADFLTHGICPDCLSRMKLELDT